MAHFKDITLQGIYEARERIADLIQETPLMYSSFLSQKWHKKVTLKLENLQPTGAFKLRGAANAILSLSESQRKLGVVTMSTGNHGKAVAYVAKKLGMKAVICISELVPEVKVEAMKALGATVVIAGKNQEEATLYALNMEKEQGLHYISPFDDPAVIAGQGTIALEILEQNPKTDTVLVPVSGGGLMSGIAFAVKSISPNIQLIGVTNDTEPAMYKSLKAGRIVPVGECESLADALPGPIDANNQYTFEMCKRFVDDLQLITEEQIAQSMAFALLKERLVLEGGGASTLALLLDERAEAFGDNVVAVCSGNNVSMDVLLEVTAKYRRFFD